jgi:hypothetical protein
VHKIGFSTQNKNNKTPFKQTNKQTNKLTTRKQTNNQTNKQTTETQAKRFLRRDQQHRSSGVVDKNAHLQTCYHHPLPPPISMLWVGVSFWVEKVILEKRPSLQKRVEHIVLEKRPPLQKRPCTKSSTLKSGGAGGMRVVVVYLPDGRFYRKHRTKIIVVSQFPRYKLKMST